MRFSLRFAVVFMLPLSLVAEAPPPPSFNFEATTETSGVGSQPAPQAEAKAAVADDKLFGDATGDLPAAPAISEEALIANSMDVAYQLYHAEDFQGSAQATQQILDRYPKKPLLPVRYLLGLSLEHTRAYNEALNQYEWLVKKAPKTTYANAASFRIGVCYQSMGRTNDAIRTFRDIIDFHHNKDYQLQAYVHLGNLYRSDRNWRQAEVIYKDLVRLFPCTTWSTTGAQYLAEAYAHQGEEDKAIRIYRLMQQDSCIPRLMQAQAQLRIADLQMASARYQQALRTYEEAINRYSDVPGIVTYSEDKIQMARDGRSLGNGVEERPRSINLRRAVQD